MSAVDDGGTGGDGAAGSADCCAPMPPATPRRRRLQPAMPAGTRRRNCAARRRDFGPARSGRGARSGRPRHGLQRRGRALAPALRRGEPASIALRMPELVEAIRSANATGKAQRIEFSARCRRRAGRRRSSRRLRSPAQPGAPASWSSPSTI